MKKKIITKGFSRKLLAVILPLMLLATLATGLMVTKHNAAHAASCTTPSMYLEDAHDGYATVTIAFDSQQATMEASGSWVNNSSGYSGGWSGRDGNSFWLFIYTNPGYGNVTWDGTVNYSAGAHSSQHCSTHVHLNANV